MKTEITAERIVRAAKNLLRGNFSGAELTEDPEPDRSPGDRLKHSGVGPDARAIKRRRTADGTGRSY